MSQCLSIPGIMNVYYLRSAYLSCDVTFRAEAGVPVKTQQQPIMVHLKGEAVCEVESQFDNKGGAAKLPSVSWRVPPTGKGQADLHHA